jgi:hypothetical protein
MTSETAKFSLTDDLNRWLPVARMTSETAKFSLTEWNGRLAVVERPSGVVIYTPPDFIRATDPGEFEPLLAALNAGGERIDAVMAYEAEAARCEEGRHYTQRHLSTRQ